MPTVLLLVSLLSVPAVDPDTVVVCPPTLRTALEPWLELRAQQGHRVAVIDNVGSAEAIRQRVRLAAGGSAPEFVVLVGDAAAAVDERASNRDGCVPTFHPAARVNVRFGSERELASDSPYGDFDADGLPEAAVGRLAADTSDELAVIIGKIAAYERNVDHGPWRRRISFVAGFGGFGPLVDGVVESTARTLLCEHIPPAYATTMTQASWQSPYCPAPPAFAAHTRSRLDEGCLFWVYLGHADRQGVDFLRVPNGGYPILMASDVGQLRRDRGGAIALFLACYAGAFDGPDDCLAEQMLRADGGPVAVVAGSRVTMPYGMSILGLEMMRECFTAHPATLGKLLLDAKRATLTRRRDDAQSRAIDGLATLLNPAVQDLNEERAEHALLFNLLGDPLLRIEHPREARLRVPSTIAAGNELVVQGDCEVDGPVDVELVVRRDRLAFTPAVRTQFRLSPAALAEHDATYARANDPRLASQRTTVTGGRLRAVLPVPADASGDCHVRVFVEGRDAFAIGSADVHVEPIESPRSARRERAAR